MSKSTIQEITSAAFKSFIQSKKICILKAQHGNVIGFNLLLQAQLEKEFKDELALGWINTQKTNYRSSAIQEFVKISIPNIGLKTANKILPGYYLFKAGKLIAFHPATIDPATIDQQVYGASAVVGAVLGLIVGIVEKDGTKGFKIFLEAMEAPVSMKVFQFFKEILGAGSSSHSQKRQKDVFDEELKNAYKLLGITSTASDSEVKKAWKELQMLHHPDHHPHEVEAKTKFSMELNNAFELIKKSRASSK